MQSPMDVYAYAKQQKAGARWEQSAKTKQSVNAVNNQQSETSDRQLANARF